MATGNPFGTPASSSSISQNGFGQTSTTGVFGAPSSKSSFATGKPAPTVNPFGGPSAPANPFGAPTVGSGGIGSASASSNGVPAPNPFGSPSFGAPSKTQTGFGESAQPGLAVNGTQDKPAQFGSRSKSPFENKNGNVGKNQYRLQGGNEDASTKQHATPPTGPKNKFASHSNGRSADVMSKFSGAQRKNNERHGRDSTQRARKPGQKGPIREPTDRTRQMSQFAYEYAQKINDRLQKENLNPPQWPADIGNPNKRGAVESLKEAYKKYRERVYKSLRDADLIDDPEKRRRLEDAIPFKGICEDMCPEYEQIQRIAEFDTTAQEKVSREDGVNPWNEPSIMVKKFGRSAAGQDAPLPMDVRSMDALRRTTDYLLDELLQSDDNLPSMHNFLWDRTRAVRRDFVFHSQKSDDEMKDLVYMLETISRFHIVAHHLLAQKGLAQSDYDPKQETEQLGRSLLSLVQAYDLCLERDIRCENEPEFRAYYLLLNAHDPGTTSRLPAYGKAFWFQSEDIQTALSLRNCMVDLTESMGPIKPRNPLTTGGTNFANYFEILKDSRVSYTMACVAEIHFTHVRQGILKNMVGAYSRGGKAAPRGITASSLNGLLQFDTKEEAIDFVELHGFEFSEWVPDGKASVEEPYLLLNDRKKIVWSPRVSPSFSAKIVERKRSGQSLPYLFRNRIYESPEDRGQDAVANHSDPDSPDDLFVSQTSPSLQQEDAKASKAAPVNSGFPTAGSSNVGSLASPATTSLSNGFLKTQTRATETASSSKPPFANPFASLKPPSEQSSLATGVSTATSPFAKATGFPTAFSMANSPLSTADGLGNLAKPADSTSPFAPARTPTAVRASTTLVNGSQASSAPVLTGDGLQSNNASSLSSVFSKPQEPKTGNESQKFPGFPPTSFTIKENAGSIGTLQRAGQNEGAKSSFFLTPSVPSSASSSGAGIGLSAPPSAPASTLPGNLNAPSISFLPSTSSQSQLIPSKLSPIPEKSTTGVSSSLGGQSPVSSQVPGPVGSALTPVQTTPFALGQSSSIAPSAAASVSLATKTVGPTQPLPRQNPKDNFVKWYALGDEGVVSMWTEYQIQHMVQEAFDQFQREELERRQKEEEEEALRQAREFQIYNLRVKYFYRWRENVRELATRRILREGKKKMREYYEKQRAIERQQRVDEERAALEAEGVARRKAQADAYQFSQIAQLDRDRRVSAEEMLLASGIFSGMHDEREIAKRVVSEADDPRRKRHRFSASQSPSVTSETTRREGWKTRSLREKFADGPRIRAQRSFSGGASVSGDFGGSLAGQRITNFTAHSRKRSADESEREPRAKRPAFKTKHWELRSRGLTPMPDGSWLPDAVAKAMHQGKRYEGIADHGLGPGQLVPEPDWDEDSEVNDPGNRLSPSKRLLHHTRASGPTKAREDLDSASHVSLDRILYERELEKKRKREAGDEPDHLPLPSSSKKVHASAESEDTESIIENTRKMIRELNDAMDRVDEEDRPWMQLQLKLMENRQSMWDGLGA